MTRAQMGRTLGDRLKIRGLELYREHHAVPLPTGASFDWWADGPGRWGYGRAWLEGMGLDPERARPF